jgi:hypothetical protein
MNKSHGRENFEKWGELIKVCGLSEALEFPSQAELINLQINCFNVSGIQRFNELMI